MKFIENLNTKEYTSFYNKFKDSHFLQSIAWGQAMEETRGKKAVYVGLKDDKENLFKVLRETDKIDVVFYKNYV